MFAKKVAANPSESGVITESSGVGFDFRELRRERHGTGSQDGFSVAESDVLAFARQVAQGAHSTAGTDASDIFAFARKAAQDTSMVGTDVSNSVLAFARQAARQSSQSGVTSELLMWWEAGSWILGGAPCFLQVLVTLGSYE
eukprot:symbB.v1.2.021150.t1/scaffold1776.1/size101794/1